MFKTLQNDWSMPDGLLVPNGAATGRMQRAASNIKINIDQAAKTFNERQLKETISVALLDFFTTK